MAKRFIETSTFRSGFLRGLPSNYKLFYLYLLCECDHNGIWPVETDVASLRIGAEVNRDDALKYFQHRIVEFDNGKKWFLPGFILFQYGKIDGGGNKIYQAVYNTLAKNNLIQHLTVAEDLTNPSVTLTEPLDNSYDTLNEPLSKGCHTVKVKVKDKVKDKIKEKEKEKIKQKEKENCVDELNSEVAQERNTGPQANDNASDSTYIPTEVQTSVKTQENGYSDFVAEYKSFIEGRGLPFRFNATDGKQIKQIISYLSNIPTNNGKPPIEAFKFILNNWSKLSAWLQTQTQLRQINSQLPNIIETLKQQYNGNAKGIKTQQSMADFARALRDRIENGSGL